MLDYALKNILRRCARSLLIVSGVAVMMTLIIVITGIVDYQIRTMNAHAAAGSGKINVQPFLAGSGYPAEGIDLTETQAEALLARASAYIQPVLSGKVLYFAIQAPLYPNQPPELILVGIEPGHEEAFTGSIARDVKPAAGSEFLAASQTAEPAVLGQHAAEVLTRQLGRAVQPGTQIPLLGQDFTVTGILERSADMVVNNAVIVPLEQAQALLEKPGFVSSAILTAANINADQDILRLVVEDFPRLTVVTDDTVRNNAREGIKVFEAMVNTISVVVVLCAALLIMTVTLITVKERTKEIGVLRALGASKGRVIGGLICEVFVLSLAGSLIGGAAAGFVLAFALQENLFSLGHIASYLPLAVGLTLLAGSAPAWNISRIMPAEALRYE
ncbi:MAG: ABC transporter permease [Anaerolineaceae bacterium]|nr:ABC transporter permease [Anaerolineaceae bacterium]